MDAALDRSGDCEHQGAAQKVLQLLVLEYSLVDSFRKTNGNEIMFTWGREYSCSRLDRIYVSSHISNRLVYSSIVRCPYSDHDAYCMSIIIIIIIFIRINNYTYRVHIKHLSTNYIKIFRIENKLYYNNYFYKIIVIQYNI